MRILFPVTLSEPLSLRSSRTAILKGALKSRHEESFERALGRAVRHLGGDYEEYLAIIAEVRDYGRVHKLDLGAAARALSDQA